MKKNLIVFYGGKSCEHDISIITALQAIENINPEKYAVTPVYISQGGIFFAAKNQIKTQHHTSQNDFKKHFKQVTLLPHSNALYALKGDKRLSKLCSIDLALICCHGMNGEDGTLQGLLELCNVPYTSASVAGSALGMDKIFLKQIFAANALPFVPYAAATRHQFKTDREVLLTKIEQTLTYPMIVKPANLGSSIGINKCQSRQELCFALSVAFKFDSRAVIETAIEELREINISAIKKDDKILVSECEEPILWQSFLSFDDKYLVENAEKGGMANLMRKFPADITEAQKTEIEDIARVLYEALLCTGVVRIDFMLDQSGKVYVNEINTIPGSLSFYLWEKQFTLADIIDISLENAQKSHHEKNMNTFAYVSDVLNHFSSNTLKGGKHPNDTQPN